MSQKNLHENNGHSPEQEHKITLTVQIEDGTVFTHDYVQKQKLQVIIEKAVAKFKLNESEGRILYREDATPLSQLDKTIEDANLYDKEVLKYLKKYKVPRGDNGFA